MRVKCFPGYGIGAVSEQIEISGWVEFSPNIFNYFYGDDDLGAVSLFGWIREDANVVETSS